MKTANTKNQESAAIALVKVMAERELGKFKESELNILLHKLAKIRGLSECVIDGYIELIKE